MFLEFQDSSCTFRAESRYGCLGERGCGFFHFGTDASDNPGSTLCLEDVQDGDGGTLPLGEILGLQDSLGGRIYVHRL